MPSSVVLLSERSEGEGRLSIVLAGLRCRLRPTVDKVWRKERRPAVCDRGATDGLPSETSEGVDDEDATVECLLVEWLLTGGGVVKRGRGGGGLAAAGTAKVVGLKMASESGRGSLSSSSGLMLSMSSL